MNFVRWKSGLPPGVPSKISRRWKKVYRITRKIRLIEDHGRDQSVDVTRAFVEVR